ncbi:MAG: YaeQ family protein [Lysobacterales bacterium]
MALKATVYKVELQISDMDRHYYATHALTLALHPSETELRLMVRVLAFALLADEGLSFGRGLSAEDEPDLWRRSLTGDIELWIDLGQPDESRVRKACGRSRQVVVVGYSGRGFGQWWDKNAAGLQRCSNLGVLEIPAASAEELVALCQRNLALQCLIQDGEVQVLSDSGSVSLKPIWRRALP